MEEGFYIIFNRNASVAELTLGFCLEFGGFHGNYVEQIFFQLMFVYSVDMIVKNYP